MMKVMVVDGGARGHAIALSYLNDSSIEEVVVAPGNDGMVGNFINYMNDENITRDASVSLKDPESIIAAAERHRPNWVDVAQDDALAAGTVNKLQEKERGIRVFGPTREAARIEWDKIWAREFMVRHSIPHPEFKAFERGNTEAVSYAEELIRRTGSAYFKASGLAAGKGVIPINNSSEIGAAFHAMRGFGDAGQRFLVEEGMPGEEFSYYAIVDGEHFLTFKSSQDNKRIWNRDKGPNTGGMGCNAPALVTRGLEQRIVEEIIEPTVRGLAEEGTPYVGILYLGGMYNPEDGSIKVVEFNSRHGDPECHVILPGISGGFSYSSLVDHAINGRLDLVSLSEDDKTRVCVIGASAGYPDKYDKGKRIMIDYNGLPQGVHLLSAGIKVEDGKMYTNGGRVFSVVAEGDNVIEARTRALQGMACCSIEDNGLHYRTDIGWRDVQRVEK